MPATCEVCGNVDPSADDDYLHVCPACIRDRRHAEQPVAELPEDAGERS